MEEWRTISGFPKYEVSNKGRVRNSRTGRIMKNQIDDRGYECVSLRNDRMRCTRRVHRLVADSFILYDSDGFDITHRDGNRLNNSSDNLIIKTRSENVRDTYRNGRRQIHKMKKIMCIETGEVFESITECAKEMRTSREAVSRCVNNQALANKYGYHFKTI